MLHLLIVQIKYLLINASTLSIDIVIFDFFKYSCDKNKQLKNSKILIFIF